MQFQHPSFLFFLGFLIIPIVLHLYSFRQYKTFYFSSISFLKNIDQESKSVRKLKQLLILISRILAITFLVFTFSQPYLPLKENQLNSRGNILAVYIDNSFSMNQLGVDGSLLSSAKEQAKKIIQTSPSGTKILLFTNELSSVEEQFTSKVNLLNRLDKIKIQPSNSSISNVINRIQNIVTHHKEIDKSSVKQFVFLSDFQKDKTIEPIKIEEKKNSYFYPFKLKPQTVDNIGIDSVWFNEPNFKIKINNELHVRVTNYGENKANNLELSLDLNKTKRTVFFDLESGKSKDLTINYTDYNAGIKKGIIHLNDKNLDFDDDFYFTYEVKPYSSILVLNGEFAHKSIVQVYSLDKYYKVKEESFGSFLPEDLKSKQLVVLNGVKEINQGAKNALKNFQSKGGSLLFLLGKESNISSWNSMLSSVGISSLSEFKNEKLECKNIAINSPFFQGVFEQIPRNISLPKTSGYYPVKNKLNNSLISLENNQPLWLNNGSSYLFTSSLDSTISSMILNSLYPVILLRIAELSQQKMNVFSFLGQNNYIQIYPSDQDTNLSISKSNFHIKKDNIDIIPLVDEVNNETFISLIGLTGKKGLEQGIYELTNGTYNSNIAFNYSREESNIEAYNEDEIESLFSEVNAKKLHFNSIESGTQSLKVDLQKPQEFWRIFLILALIFVLTEMVLTRFMK
jgi:hypothetical protein